MKNLDLLTVPLENVNLIEASAGTGKTFFISNLFLRLVLEKELPVQEILVVTFTDAATKELKERIRGNMLEAQKIVEACEVDDSDVVAKIINQYCGRESREKAYKLLRRALLNIDEMSVFTIHGFCQRMLNENAFESKVAFDLELMPDASDLLEEVVDDYWRREEYGEKTDVLTIKMERSRDDLLQIAHNFVGNPDLKTSLVWNETSNRSDLKSAYQKVLDILQINVSEILDVLRSKDNKIKKGTKDSAEVNLKKILAGELTPIANFTVSHLNSLVTPAQKKKGVEALPHEFFDLCEEFYEIYENEKNRLTLSYIDYVRSEFRRRKLSSQVQTYDDILQNLQAALCDGSDSAELFLQLIRSKFKVAMIDEFQDTDPVQNAIFKKIFIDNSELPLFMIGDPKQSIYAFRGADVFAYLNAKADADEIYNLGVNYRSEDKMVAAVNHFFTQDFSTQNSAINPFVYGQLGAEKNESGINYKSVAGSGKELKLVVPEDSNQSPLKINYISHPNDKSFTQEQARRLTIDFVTAEISRLLNGTAYFEKSDDEQTVVKPGDIAILTSSHMEARAIQKSLSYCNINSVVQNSGNVLQSDEAREIQLFLTAVLTLREQAIKAFFTTRFADIKASTLYAEMESGGKTKNIVVAWINRLMELKKIWVDKGFISMYQQLLRTTKLRSRLLASTNGERSLTNFLHLGELLHKAEQENSLCQDGLNDWFTTKLSEQTGDDDEYLMRLESDSDTVKIMTVHKSKGLEFKIVFCPFFWTKKFKESSSGKSFSFQNDGELIYELNGGGGKSRQLWRKEQLAEQIRLIYVGLTRAVSRCYVVTGDFNNSGATALSYLTAADGLKSAEELDNFIASPPKTVNFGELQKSFAAENCIEVKRVEGDDFIAIVASERSETVQLTEAETFTRAVRRDWGIGSFSGLTRFASHGHKAAEQIKVHDDEEQVTDVVENPSADDYKFFDFPRGATVGSAVHEIFEDIDFTAEPDTFNDVIEQKIKNFGLARGIDDEHYQADLEDKKNTLHEMVMNVLSAPIKELGDFRLNQLSSRDRLVEMQFYYKIESISAELLQATFAKYGVDVSGVDFAQQLGSLNFSLKRGFMTGFIDLLFEYEGKFYVLDWKTNHLGSAFSNYSKAAMTTSMSDSYYILQYHLYVIALHLYLQQRLGDSYDYDKCMGGIVYAYVRGMHPDHEGKGVFYDRPSYELIAALTELIVGVK